MRRRLRIPYFSPDRADPLTAPDWTSALGGSIIRGVEDRLSWDLLDVTKDHFVSFIKIRS